MKEKRTFEVRSLNEDYDHEKYCGVVEGYAVVFETPATYEYTEIIDRNALNNTNMTDCVLRYNHSEDGFSVARTRNGSLELRIDDTGLYIKAYIINTQFGRDLYRMIEEGLVDQMSFAFSVTRQEWNDETNTRRILEIDKLYDVSAVDQPFYVETSIFARTLNDFKEEYRKQQLELEKAKLLAILELED